MSSIHENIANLIQKIDKKSCKLIAVTKTQPLDKIKEAYQAGCRSFGENRVQELIEKQSHLPSDIEWHMIGHLQTNKVKYIAPFIHLIHSVDSIQLLREINKQAQKHNRIIPCLLQLHIAEEETKFGLSTNELQTILESREYEKLPHITINGLMGIATLTADEQVIRKEFQLIKRWFETIKTTYRSPHLIMNELSIGMSHDYAIALDEGSTMIRIGSAIFGERHYPNP